MKLSRPRSALTALALCMALQMTGLVILQPLFALRFESFGAGVKALSVSAMVYALSCTITAPFIGILADRSGRRPVLLASMAGLVIASTGFLFSARAWELILLRGLAGVCMAGLAPTAIGIVGDLAPQNRRGQWIGIVNGGASAGWVAGPLLGGLLHDRFGYVVPFAVSAVMAAVGLLLALSRIPETHPPAARLAGAQSMLKLSWRALPARATFIVLMCIGFGVTFAYALIEPQFMFYAYDDLHWTPSTLGLAMSSYGVMFMLGELGLGALSDRVGRKPVLLLGLALFSAQFIGLALFRDLNLIVGSFLLAGLGNALYDPALNAMLIDSTPPEYTARVIGIKSTAASLGSLLGPGLAVVITTLMNPRGIFLSAFVWVMVLLFCAGYLIKPKKIIRGTYQSSGAAP